MSPNAEKEGRKRERRGKKAKTTYMRKRNRRQRMARGKVTKTTRRNKAWERTGETRARGEYHYRWEREEIEQQTVFCIFFPLVLVNGSQRGVGSNKCLRRGWKAKLPRDGHVSVINNGEDCSRCK